MKDGYPISIAELIAAGQRPLPSEAVAIVLDLCRQVMGRVPGASVLRPFSTATLFLDASGTVAVAGGVAAEDDQTVQLMGRLLLDMLPPTGASGPGHEPVRLRTLASRAAAGDLARVKVAVLAARLRRFGPEEPQAAIRGLFERWRLAGPERLNGRMSRRGPEERRVKGPGPDVMRRWLREADAEAYRLASTTTSPSGGGRRTYRRLMGLLAAVLLMLAGLGATYWLRADEARLWVPAPPPAPARQAPSPPQPGWELLPEASDLMVRGTPVRRPVSPGLAPVRPPGDAPMATTGQSER